MSHPENETARCALSIAAALAAAGPGDKAQARRMGPGGCAFFWRQVAQLGISPQREAGWLIFTRLVALMTPASRATSIHDGARPLGAAMAEAGLSEQRFARLLAARGETRLEALERAIRLLARKVRGVDVCDLAQAIFLPADTSNLARRYYEKSDHVKDEDTQDA